MLSELSTKLNAFTSHELYNGNENSPPSQGDRLLLGSLEHWQRPSSFTLASASDRADQGQNQSQSCNGLGPASTPLQAASKSVEYVLRGRPRDELGQTARAIRKRFVPSKPPRSPKAGERGVNSESVRNLDALVATALRLEPVALISLVPPPSHRITVWEDLEAVWAKLKARLSYLKKAEAFPPLVCVVEFDGVDDGERFFKVANFHVGFGETLSDQQIQSFKKWWLKLMETESNQGRTFQYDSKERGDKLAKYLSKDVTFRGGGGPRPVKWPPEWVPKRIRNRLWFSRGLTNAGSKEGREINKKRGMVRRHFPADRGLE